MRFTSFAVFSIFLISASETPANAVVLSEIMFNPAGEESSDEFIELYNESALPLNLAGFTLSDGDAEDTLASAGMGLLALPGQFILILDPDYIEDESTTYDELVPEDALVVTIRGSTFGSRGLSNSSAETVSIFNSAQELLAAVTYDLDTPAGHSYEKINLTAGDGDTNWGFSQSEHGTPGARNSITPPVNDLSISRFTAIPPQPHQGESVTLEIMVENNGLSIAVNMLLLEQEVASESELLESWNISLVPGDSTLLTATYEYLADEPIRLIASLSSPDDMPENNSRTLTLGGAGTSGAILINEIMYRPDAGTAEWVELVNVSGSDQIMTGWQLAEGAGIADSTERFQFPEYTLPADSFLLLAADSSIFFLNPPTDAQVLLWSEQNLAFNNNGDSLALLNSLRETIDRVDYLPGWGDDHQGVSLERVSDAAASNDPLNWASSLDTRGATPGEQNSRALPENLAPINLLHLAPNPFSPDDDGHDDLLAIRFRLNDADARVDLKIFDVRGREVRRLANNAAAGFTGELLWDGRSDDGRQLPTGMYVIYLEALGDGGTRIQSTKRVVALVRPS